ncbi:hypothetical protein FHS07_003098 [Microbacterium proteolyticum]|uniref:Uncharacterized protein n=1 Tax=Microbacterium proteolyticum TaxID=1572644 RepID=A0A7W5CKI4_9MICO|nr:hypothetical protein [Microbacterium proteolyticum]
MSAVVRGTGDGRDAAGPHSRRPHTSKDDV